MDSSFRCVDNGMLIYMNQKFPGDGMNQGKDVLKVKFSIAHWQWDTIYLVKLRGKKYLVILMIGRKMLWNTSITTSNWNHNVIVFVVPKCRRQIDISVWSLAKNVQFIALLLVHTEQLPVTLFHFLCHISIPCLLCLVSILSIQHLIFCRQFYCARSLTWLKY